MLNASRSDVFDPNDVGIIETDEAHCTLYPNPASTSVAIESTKPMSGVALFDMSGRQVMSIDDIYGKDHIVLNLSGIANGIYTLRIAMGESLSVQKLVVK